MAHLSLPKELAARHRLYFTNYQALVKEHFGYEGGI